MLEPIDLLKYYTIQKNKNSIITEMLNMANVAAGEHLMVIKNQADEELLLLERAR